MYGDVELILTSDTTKIGGIGQGKIYVIVQKQNGKCASVGDNKNKTYQTSKTSKTYKTYVKHIKHVKDVKHV